MYRIWNMYATRIHQCKVKVSCLTVTWILQYKYIMLHHIDVFVTKSLFQSSMHEWFLETYEDSSNVIDLAQVLMMTIHDYHLKRGGLF